MKMIKRFALIFAALLMIASGALAADLDTQRNVALTVVFRDDGKGVAGAEFNIYRVADADQTGKYTLLAPFDRYHVNINVQSESAMAGVAATLEGYVLRDQIAPAYSGVTDQAGEISFNGNGQMKQGLYLVMGKRHVSDGIVYTIQPSMVQLPTRDAANQTWVYDVIVNAKYEAQPDSPDQQTISRKVLKVWDADGHENRIPKEIVVHLLQDGTVFDTVRLNADNLWRYTWPELDADHHWSVVEEELEDYSVIVTCEGITFVVTNSYDPDEPTLAPTPSPTPPPDNSSDDPKLPQTGQLWWPVAMLVFAGLLLIVIGLVRRRGN